jgi:putative protease
MAKSEASEKPIGHISHFFGKIEVGIIELKAPLKVGDTIHLQGHITDFVQKVDSLQIEHLNVPAAKPGDAVGIKVKQHVREGDEVFLVA